MTAHSLRQHHRHKTAPTIFASIGLLALFALVLVSSEVTAREPAIEQSYNQLVSEDSLRLYVRDLVAMGPRLGGTTSNKESAQYLSRRLRSFGLETRIQQDPLQLTYEAESWQLRMISPRHASFARPWPYIFSPASKLLRAEVVPVSSAAHAGAVRGKVALVDEVVKPAAYRSLVEAGAAAILSDGPGRDGAFTSWAMIGRLPASTANPVPVFAISREDGNKIRGLIANGETAVVEFGVEARTFTDHPQTVIARLEGRQPDQKIIYCAHGDSDSGGPGADDNASGMAAVLETARVLQRLIEQKLLPQPKFTIEFVVWGSEYHSSQAYVERHAQRLDEIRSVINFDEVGTGTEYQAIYFEGNDVPWNAGLLDTLDQIGRDYCQRTGFWPAYTTNPTQGGTDSYAFLPWRYRGQLKLPYEIPATTIFTAAWDELSTLRQTAGWQSSCWPQSGSVDIDYSQYYHSSGDIPELTTEKEPWRMAWAAKAGGMALLRILW